MKGHVSKDHVHHVFCDYLVGHVAELQQKWPRAQRCRPQKLLFQVRKLSRRVMGCAALQPLHQAASGRNRAYSPLQATAFKRWFVTEENVE
jgi:hypothetical protein